MTRRTEKVPSAAATAGMVLYPAVCLLLTLCGRYAPERIGGWGVEIHRWAPRGFVEYEFLRRIHRVPRSLDTGFWHEGEKSGDLNMDLVINNDW